MEIIDDIDGSFWSMVTILTKQARKQNDQYRNKITQLIREIDDSDTRRMRFEELLTGANKNLQNAKVRIEELEAKENNPLFVMTPHEIQSGLDRVAHAELLINQLPEDHDGRNTWLMNFGKMEQAEFIRKEYNEKKSNV